MSKSKNNALYIGIAVAVVVVIAIIVGVVLGNKNGGSAPGEVDPGTSQVDFSTIDESIGFGDFENMEVLSKKIQNGEAMGEIVSIEGVVSHPMSTYSVVQESADGTKKIGTEFVVEGFEEADYPEDGTRIVVTGQVVEKSPLYYIIQTTPDYIQVIEVAD